MVVRALKRVLFFMRRSLAQVQIPNDDHGIILSLAPIFVRLRISRMVKNRANQVYMQGSETKDRS